MPSLVGAGSLGGNRNVESEAEELIQLIEFEKGKLKNGVENLIIGGFE